MCNENCKHGLGRGLIIRNYFPIINRLSSDLFRVRSPGNPNIELSKSYFISPRSSTLFSMKYQVKEFMERGSSFSSTSLKKVVSKNLKRLLFKKLSSCNLEKFSG